MATPEYLSEPQIQSLSRLLKEILEGNLRLPLFQRDFVWSNDQRLELLNSVREGIPIGSVLVWRTASRRLECFESVGPHRLPARPAMDGLLHSYLLDGLQRLTSLLGSIYIRSAASEPTQTGRSIGKDLEWDVYYDLENRVFRVGDEEKVLPTWQPLWLTLDSIGLLKFQRELTKQPESDRLIEASDQLVSAFRDYKIPVLAIVTEDLEQATRIFHRINSRGTPMGEFHMVQALTWREGFDLREKLTLAKARLKDEGWEPDPQEDLFLDVCKASLDLDIFEENVEVLSKRLVEEPRIMEEATDNVLHAVRFLKEECGILSSELLPTRYQLILLADAMRVWRASTFEPEVKRHLTRWFWLTSYGNTFRAVNGNKLQRILIHLRKLARGETELAIGEERLSISPFPERFHYRAARSKLLSLHLARLKPCDSSGQPIENPVELLAIHGSDAVVPLFRNHAESANRILVRPQDAQPMRDLLQGKLLMPCSKEVLDSHAISPLAAQALRKQEIDMFLHLRGRAIHELDNAFIRDLLDEETAFASSTGTDSE